MLAWKESILFDPFRCCCFPRYVVDSLLVCLLCFIRYFICRRFAVCTIPDELAHLCLIYDAAGELFLQPDSIEPHPPQKRGSVP